MEFINAVLRITMIIFLIRAVITIATGFIMSRRMQKAQRSTELMNEKMLQIKMMEQKRLEESELQKHLVKDDYCGRMIDRTKAFIMHCEGKTCHFCSWECREKYLEETVAI